MPIAMPSLPWRQCSRSSPALAVVSFSASVALVGVQWYLVVFVYVSLVTADGGHLLVCLSVIHVTSVVKCLPCFCQLFKIELLSCC